MKQYGKTWLLIAAVTSLLLSYGSNLVNPYYYDVIIGIGINIILAVGLNLVNGYTGQFSLGHAGFMAVGAYVGASITVFLGGWYGGIFGEGMIAEAALFLFSLIAGGLAAALAGFVVGGPSLRLKGDYLAIVTLGFGEIIRVIIQNMEVIGGSRGFSVPMRTDFFWTYFFWTYSFAALSIYVVLALVHSTYGRGFLTVRDDEIAAEATGINPTRYKVLAFVVGAFFAGIAGGLYAHFKQYVHPEGFNL